MCVCVCNILVMFCSSEGLCGMMGRNVKSVCTNVASLTDGAGDSLNCDINHEYH